MAKYVKTEQGYIDMPNFAPAPFKPEGKSYLTFSSSNRFTLAVYDATKHWNGILEYFSADKVWAVWDGTTTLSAVSDDGEYFLYLRGTGNKEITGFTNGHKYKWVLTGSEIACTGNIENLLDYGIVESGGHPTMASDCYNCIFEGCTALTQAPDLPATTLANYCYHSMFSGCTALTQAPALPAKTLTGDCYSSMFYGCTSLTKAPALPATTLVDYCYHSMFYGCTSLTQAPELPATSLVTKCYDQMFYGCRSIKLSSTQTGEYTQEYIVGYTSNYAYLMFYRTGGTFTGTPDKDTYYLSTDNMIVRDTEIATLNGYVGSMIDNSVSNPLNITGATVGQIAKITAVDESGKPTSWEAADIYEKPTSGIPKSDLAQSVQTSLDKANTAISYDSQTLTEAQQKQARTNIGAGQPLFVVNVTTTLSEQGDEVYTADKTAAEIETAYQEGCEIVCRMSVPTIGMGLVPVQLPLASRRGRQIFMFAINQTMWTDKSSRIVSYLVTIADDGVNVGQNNTEIYIKPSSGIPKTHLADDVQTSLAKADTAISLGLTSATPGQIIKVKAVQDGKPTEWEAVDMDAEKIPKFTKLLTHTITEDELAASPIAFVWGTAQIPNLNDFNVFVLTIVRPDGTKIKFNKWVRLKINNTLMGNICGTVTAESSQYAITANRLFGVWISGNYYDPRNIGVPVLAPPWSPSTFQSNLPDSEPVTSIGFTSYVADYGLTAGIVVEIWGAK